VLKEVHVQRMMVSIVGVINILARMLIAKIKLLCMLSYDHIPSHTTTIGGVMFLVVLYSHRRECSHISDEPISAFKFTYPQYWDAKQTGDPSYIELKASSAEYKMVEAKLAAATATAPKVTLVKLERYQSFQLLNRYLMQRSVIVKRAHNKDKPSAAEMQLFHAVTVCHSSSPLLCLCSCLCMVLMIIE
jgi:hypothetical protein